MSWLPDAVRWYLTLAAVTWAFAPLAHWVGGRLPDRGATLARPLGLIALVWPTWFLASFTPFPFSTIGLWATAVAGAAIGWHFAYHRKWISREWLIGLAVTEAVSLVIFLGYLGLRGYTPRITGTEKPMDIAFLSASARATDLPPLDPWFAGEHINYYYLGYFIHGSLARMSGVETWVAFNLALATTVAMTIAGAAGFVYAAGKAWLGKRAVFAFAALGAFLVAISGNLFATVKFLEDPRATIDASWWGRIGWASSRVVIDNGSPQAETINEFPWFSFLLGDLHPHVTALPFTILALALAVVLLRHDWKADGHSIADVARLAVVGIAIGALYPLNSWDFPTYLIAALGALLFASGWRVATLERGGIVVAASLIAWLPFWVSFVPFAGSTSGSVPDWLADLPGISRLFTTVGYYDGERTSSGEFLTVFGITWCFAVLYLAVETVRVLRADGQLKLPGRALIGVVIVLFLAISISAPVLILAGAPFTVSVWLVWRNWKKELDARLVISGLFAAGFALILITEFFYIQDVFAGRFNTLFKVYYQVWTMFGLGAALGAGLLWQQAEKVVNKVTPRALLAGGIVLALAAGSVYPVIASDQWTKWAGPRNWEGLDGLAFVGDSSAGDEAAIRWLSENADGDDVVLEAPGCQYTLNFGEPTSRISAFTGMPTIIGWNGSEGQWRRGQDSLLSQIGPRADEVAEMYADPQSPLFDQFGVTLLYVGRFESQGAGRDCAIAGPFPAVENEGYPGDGWTLVFESDHGRLYRRGTN
jgi:YYY domain-containing protein